ncbi:hypothetical protein [Deinococcus sp. PEB2-67]
MTIHLDTASWRRDYLRDMPLPDPRGRPMTDESVLAKWRAVTAAFERQYAVLLSPHVVRLGDATLRTELTTDLPILTRDAMDYDPRSFEGDRFANLRLPIGPVRRVLTVALKLPGMPYPAEYQRDWVQVKHRRKTISIYPGGRTVSAMPLLAGGMALIALNGGSVIPNAWQIAYEAGYSADDLAGRDADVLAALSKLLALELLIPGSADQHLQAGVTGRSVSVDGLSQNTNLMQSAGALKFKPLMDAYSASYQEWAGMYEHRRSGPKFTTL